MRRITRSDAAITLNISPNVPSVSEKPAALASVSDSDPVRRPTATRTPVPASDSFRFCAWAGPCEPQPMTPICEIPASAFGKRGNRLRPPRRKLSSTPSSSIRSTVKTFDSKRLGRRFTCFSGFTSAKSRLFACRGIGPEQLHLGRLFGERLQRCIRIGRVVDLEIDVEPVLPRPVRHGSGVEPGQVDAALGKALQGGDKAARLVGPDESKRGLGEAGGPG